MSGYTIIENLKNLIQTEMLLKFNIDNEIYKLIIALAIISTLSYFFNYIPTIINYLLKSFFVKFIKNIIYDKCILYLINILKKEKKDRVIIIHSKTPQFKIMLFYIGVTTSDERYLDSNIVEVGSINSCFCDEETSRSYDHSKTCKGLQENFTTKYIIKDDWNIIKYENIDVLFKFVSGQNKERYSFEGENKNITTYYDLHIKTDNFDSTFISNLMKYCNAKNKEYICIKNGSDITIENNKIKIFSNTSFTGWTETGTCENRYFDTLILKNGEKEKIINDLDKFNKAKIWYNKKNIPYNRGYLFYGVPGSGKTSCIKAIASYCKRDIYYLSLDKQKYDNESFISSMRKIDYKKSIVVIEDVDCSSNVVKKREVKKSKGNELTLSGLLNIIDGVYECSDRILIMTSNHIEILDEALIRPGRIDMLVKFDYCDEDQIKKLYEFYYEKPYKGEIKLSAKITPAKICSILQKNMETQDKAIEEIELMTDKIDKFDCDDKFGKSIDIKSTKSDEDSEEMSNVKMKKISNEESDEKIDDQRVINYINFMRNYGSESTKIIPDEVSKKLLL